MAGSTSIDDGETFLNDLLSAGDLSHFGVLGMHWGIRKPSSQRELSSDHKDISSLRKKHPSELSTAELKKVNDRKQAEKKYKELNPDSISKGKKIAAGILAAAGTATTIYNLTNSPAGKAGLTKGKAAYASFKLASFIIKHPVEG